MLCAVGGNTHKETPCCFNPLLRCVFFPCFLDFTWVKTIFVVHHIAQIIEKGIPIYSFIGSRKKASVEKLGWTEFAVTRNLNHQKTQDYAPSTSSAEKSQRFQVMLIMFLQYLSSVIPRMEREKLKQARGVKQRMKYKKLSVRRDVAKL